MYVLSRVSNFMGMTSRVSVALSIPIWATKVSRATPAFRYPVCSITHPIVLRSYILVAVLKSAAQGFLAKFLLRDDNLTNPGGKSLKLLQEVIRLLLDAYYDLANSTFCLAIGMSSSRFRQRIGTIDD